MFLKEDGGGPMRNRIAVTGAALAVALLGACTTHPAGQISNMASVTVDGKQKKFNQVKCSQVEWFRMIDIGGDFSGAKLQVDERREPVITQSVHIQNVGGFTGMYSQGDGSDAANTNLSDGRFTITGTAHGSRTDNSSEPATATFKVVVTC
jgi:ipoprotein LpqH